LIDVSLPFARLFAVKDEKEVELMRKSALASMNAWDYLKKKIVSVVDTEKVGKKNGEIDCRFQ
jgi:nucleosome binding factor SPN SPT16 subunit